MWVPRNAPIFFCLRLRSSARFSSTSCMPTEICVGRRLSIVTGLTAGSRAHDIALLLGWWRPALPVIVATPITMRSLLQRTAEDEDEKDQRDAHQHDRPISGAAA